MTDQERTDASAAEDQVEVSLTSPEETPAEPASADGPVQEPTAEQATIEPDAMETVAAEPAAETEPVADADAADDEPVATAADEPVAAAEPEPVTSAAEPDAVSAPAAPSAPAPRPVPRPMPRPPLPGARPAAPTAGPAAPAAAAPVVPPPPALSEAEAAEAARWGRVDDDGTVWVREESGERAVGQYPGADAADALAFYVRRYADLHAKVLLTETRMAGADLSVKEIDSTLDLLEADLTEPAAVGDLASLRERLAALREVAAARHAEADAQRAAAKQAALEARTAIVEEAERIAGTDPERIQWRPAGEQLRLLLDQWKDAQRHGPRVDRASEDALWKRFSHARSSFDRERRRFFADLEKHNTAAKAEKQALVAEAEKLATSTEWGATSAAYRDLMTRWKAAGRASRKDDDALWSRFRAAQDAFFSARDLSQKQTDAEFTANLQVKLDLLTQAEKLVPVTDLPRARAALRDIQEKWEQAGKVPRDDIQRVEGRLRAVEQAVREAEQNQWQRSNPETLARAEGAAAQLEAAIAGLEADLAAAKAAGNDRKVAEAQTALDARRAWLEQVQRAAEESR